MLSAVTRRPVRRILTVAAGVLAAALTLAACSSAPAEKPASTTKTETSEVVITHAHGETKIPGKPKRVVALSWMTPDVVAALGVNPVGIEENWGANEKGYLPWFEDYVNKNYNGELPTIIPRVEEGPNYEAIKALNPDLILGLYSGITDVEYKRLSSIAPTVPYIDGAWDPGTWEEMTRTVGKALGEDAKAEQLVTETETYVASVAAAHPEFAGKTFAWGVALGEGSTEAGLYLDYDPRVRLTEALGLSSTPAQKMLKEKAEDGVWYAGVSLERLDEVPADLFVAWANGPEDVKYSLDNKVFNKWQPMAGNHYAFYSNAATAAAISGPTVLSLPAVLTDYADQLSGALNGNGFADTK